MVQRIEIFLYRYEGVFSDSPDLENRISSDYDTLVVWRDEREQHRKARDDHRRVDVLCFFISADENFIGDEREYLALNSLWQDYLRQPKQPIMILLSSHSPS